MSTFVHFTDMNREVLVEYFFLGGEGFKEINPFCTLY